MKTQRFWLTPQEDSGSHVVVEVGERSSSVTLADCNRRITWNFPHGTPEVHKGSLKKAKKVQKLFNDLVEHLEKQTPKRRRRRAYYLDD